MQLLNILNVGEEFDLNIERQQPVSTKQHDGMALRSHDRAFNVKVRTN